MKTFTTIKYTYVLCLTGIILTTMGCDKFLAIDDPKTELATSSVFTSSSTVNAAMISIYSRMVNGSLYTNIPWLTGISSDEFTNYMTSQNTVTFYNNSLTSANPTIANNIWTPAYNYIYQANAIIEGLEEYNGVTDDLKKQIMGEARFIRAFYHFYAICFFGDVPIVTSTDYQTNAVLPRSPKSQVYEQIIEDLLEAKQLLNTNYVGRDGLTTSTERVRPNRAVAQALLARVYLYAEEYEKAEQEATDVISNPLYQLSTNLNTIFLKNNQEAIWQLQPIPNGLTPEGRRFILLTAPSTSSTERNTTISPQLKEAFEGQDRRKVQWMDSITVAGRTHVFPSKYKMGNATVNNTTEYSTILRLGEQFLIRAEARIRQGKDKEGLEDINRLRARADVNQYDIETVSDPLSVTLKERNLELFSEGHRWFDLIRFGKIDEVMTIVTPTKGGTWSTHAKLYPIPETERNNNPNLTQNDDY